MPTLRRTLTWMTIVDVFVILVFYWGIREHAPAREQSLSPLSIIAVLLIVAGMAVCFAYYRLVVIRREGGTHMEALALVLLATPLLVVLLIDVIMDADIFEKTGRCAAPSVRDYYLYVSDNIAKGVLIDLMQSYGIDLFECRPKRSWEVGTLNFLIRSYSTYLVIWAAAQLWVAWRRRKTRASGA
jgi:hypothetical protein